MFFSKDQINDFVSEWERKEKRRGLGTKAQGTASFHGCEGKEYSAMLCFLYFKQHRIVYKLLRL